MIRGPGGIRLFIIDEVLKETRGWIERLFTLPWRPLQKIKYVPNPAYPENGEIYTKGQDIYCNHAQAQELRKILCPDPLSNTLYTEKSSRPPRRAAT